MADRALPILKIARVVGQLAIQFEISEAVWTTVVTNHRCVHRLPSHRKSHSIWNLEAIADSEYHILKIGNFRPCREGALLRCGIKVCRPLEHAKYCPSLSLARFIVCPMSRGLRKTKPSALGLMLAPAARQQNGKARPRHQSPEC